MSLTRRDFMVGCSAAIAAMAGGSLNRLAFANPADSTQRDIVVAIFLRGGCDALNLVAPTNDADYMRARPTLRVRSDGTEPGWSLSNPLGGLDFRLHPKAKPLFDLYQSGDLAIVHACGLTNGTRSHFDAMDYMERGTPSSKTTSSGWLTRHLLSVGTVSNSALSLPAIAVSSNLPESLLGSTDAIAMSGPANFRLGGNSFYAGQQTARLRELYQGSSELHKAGTSTLDTIDALQDRTVPASEGYPGDGLSNALKSLAQIIKMDVGLQVATVDFGGWDTHESQSWIFANLVETLARALEAFYNDLASYRNRLVVVVMSEFGRRLKANDSDGTDHGHGGAMLVLGGNVNGGKMHGTWPGLAEDQLDNRVDLQVTTDYRAVLSEILVHRAMNHKLGTVFPGITPEVFSPQTRLNIVRGSNPAAIDYTSSLPSNSPDGTLYLPLVRR